MQLVTPTDTFSLHGLVPFGIPMEQQGLHKYATMQRSFRTVPYGMF